MYWRLRATALRRSSIRSMCGSSDVANSGTGTADTLAGRPTDPAHRDPVGILELVLDGEPGAREPTPALLERHVVAELADAVAHVVVGELPHGRLAPVDVDRDLALGREPLGEVAKGPLGVRGVVQDLLAVDEVELAEVREVVE